MKETGLIDHEQNDRVLPLQFPFAKSGSSDQLLRIRHSALWAAYGDALGWISELTDAKGLARRTGGAPLQYPVEWKRRIGGRSGVTVRLPKGCYSDDSQLRLATGRSIRSDGFDVEAFSKVELPVWLSYALGGGRSTKAAAKHLSRRDAQWFANKYKGWANSGGNGAAMRIQPHVWASRNPGNPSTFLDDVILNAICTHSNPHGILGAVLHAMALAHAMVTEYPPEPEDLIGALERASSHVEKFWRDGEIGHIWMASFEEEAGSFNDAWKRSIADCKEAIESLAPARHLNGPEAYSSIIDTLGLRKNDRRGSGLLTSIAAVALTWCEMNPERALTIAANEIGTDTDTIATMAGAILGMNVDTEPPVEVMDADLFRSEARRMYEISIGQDPKGFRYPDLLHWTAPKTQADALIATESAEYGVLGLGPVKPVHDPIQSPNPVFLWQWVVTSFGQNLLIKRRSTIPRWGTGLESPVDNLVDVNADQPIKITNVLKQSGVLNHSKIETTEGDIRPQYESESISQRQLQRMIDHLEHHNYEDSKIGPALRRVASNCTVDQAHWFSAVLIERLRRVHR